MKVPYNWLKDYAEVNVDPHTLGDKLTLSGSALEEVIIQGDKIVGAVTHAIVGDNAKGYGILITTMLKEGED